MRSPRVGIVGAGQLGRMMALAAYPLGIECRFVDATRDSPGGQVAPVSVAALDDAAALESLARDVDVVTFDIENVSTDALRRLQQIVPVHPGPDAVATAQDRLSEKTLFAELGIPTGAFRAVDSLEALQAAAADLGLPLVLKARRLGYDGRGQRVIEKPAEVTDAWESLGQVPSLAEAFVRFEREVSLIGVRGTDGTIVSYPLAENRHADGILRTTVAPYPDTSLHATAHASLVRILERFDYVGVLTIEFFETAGGLLANEIAPRVHNSGHWTIEGAATSQFENHVRAILGLPLGSAEARGHSAMVNLLGVMPDRATALAVNGLHLHDYGKTARPARKLGHCTITDADRGRLMTRLAGLEQMLATSAALN